MRSKKLIIIGVLAVILILAIAGSAYALTTECSLNGLCDPTATTFVGAAAGSNACPMADDAAVFPRTGAANGCPMANGDAAGNCAPAGGGCCGSGESHRTFRPIS